MFSIKFHQDDIKYKCISIYTLILIIFRGNIKIHKKQKTTDLNFF